MVNRHNINKVFRRLKRLRQPLAAKALVPETLVSRMVSRENSRRRMKPVLVLPKMLRRAKSLSLTESLSLTKVATSLYLRFYITSPESFSQSISNSKVSFAPLIWVEVCMDFSSFFPLVRAGDDVICNGFDLMPSIDVWSDTEESGNVQRVVLRYLFMTWS